MKLRLIFLEMWMEVVRMRLDLSVRNDTVNLTPYTLYSLPSLWFSSERNSDEQR